MLPAVAIFPNIISAVLGVFLFVCLVRTLVICCFSGHKNRSNEEVPSVSAERANILLLNQNDLGLGEDSFVSIELETDLSLPVIVPGEEKTVLSDPCPRAVSASEGLDLHEKEPIPRIIVKTEVAGIQGKSEGLNPPEKTEVLGPPVPKIVEALEAEEVKDIEEIILMVSSGSSPATSDSCSCSEVTPYLSDLSSSPQPEAAPPPTLGVTPQSNASSFGERPRVDGGRSQPGHTVLRKHVSWGRVQVEAELELQATATYLSREISTQTFAGPNVSTNDQAESNLAAVGRASSLQTTDGADSIPFNEGLTSPNAGAQSDGEVDAASGNFTSQKVLDLVAGVVQGLVEKVMQMTAKEDVLSPKVDASDVAEGERISLAGVHREAAPAPRRHLQSLLRAFDRDFGPSWSLDKEACSFDLLPPRNLSGSQMVEVSEESHEDKDGAHMMDSSFVVDYSRRPTPLATTPRHIELKPPKDVLKKLREMGIPVRENSPDNSMFLFSPWLPAGSHGNPRAVSLDVTSQRGSDSKFKPILQAPTFHSLPREEKPCCAAHRASSPTWQRNMFSNYGAQDSSWTPPSLSQSHKPHDYSDQHMGTCQHRCSFHDPTDFGRFLGGQRSLEAKVPDVEPTSRWPTLSQRIRSETERSSDIECTIFSSSGTKRKETRRSVRFSDMLISEEPKTASFPSIASPLEGNSLENDIPQNLLDPAGTSGSRHSWEGRLVFPIDLSSASGADVNSDLLCNSSQSLGARGACGGKESPVPDPAATDPSSGSDFSLSSASTKAG